MGPGEIRLLLGHCPLGQRDNSPPSRVTDTSTQGHEVDQNKGQATRDNGTEKRLIPATGSSQSKLSPRLPTEATMALAASRSE